MILFLRQVLPPDAVRWFRERLASVDFGDGAATAGSGVRDIKRNLELPPDSPVRAELNQKLAQTLDANGTFRYGIVPKQMGAFIFSRYEGGMTYGDHMDNPIMEGPQGRMRSDLSMTVFLSDPGEYDGGELVMHSDTMPQPIKMPAGDAVIYPTTTIHRVEPVTRGTRWAAVTWMQSMVRTDDQRQVLWDILLVMDWLGRNRDPEDPDQRHALRLMERARFNLLRLWADP